MRNHYKPGSWNCICDVCGFKFKSDELRKRWDGVMVCEADFETRHPSDLLRVPKEDTGTPWSRPEPTNTFIEVLTVDFSASATTGTEPLSVTFTPTVTGYVSEYAWTFTTGAQVQTSTLESPTVILAGGYTTVSLTITGVEETATETKTNYIYVEAGGGF